MSNVVFLMAGFIEKKMHFVNKNRDFLQEIIHGIVFNSLSGTDKKYS